MPNPVRKETEDEAPHLQLSLVQVIAAALAAITSAVILSKFGVAGTYVGTAAGSVVSTIAVAVYAHTMRQARRRVRRYAHHHHEDAAGPRPHRPRMSAGAPVATPSAAWNRHHPSHVSPITVRTPSSPPRARPGWSGWLTGLERWFIGLPHWGRAAVTGVVAFLLAVTVIVLFQFLSGHTLANWRVGAGSSGPLNGGCVIGQCGTPAPTAAGQGPTPGATSQPTSQPTVAPTSRPAPTSSPAATPAATPTPASFTPPSPLATSSP